MEATGDDPKNEEESESDEDEDASLASFCASLSGTANSSSEETLFMKRDTNDKKKLISLRKRREIESPRFCSQCDIHSVEGTLSTKSKMLCIVCDEII
jgi:hypothetical protein